MTPELLKPLDHLSYLLECAALDYTGELKTELGELCRCLRAGYSHIPEAVQSLPQLERALESYRANRKAEGASDLAAVSRSWWAAVAQMP